MRDINEPFWTMLEPEYKRAMMFCRKLMGDRDKGDDLFQDGLVRALMNVSSLRDVSTFRPWLYRILINTYRSRVRQKWWRRLTPLNVETEPALGADDPGDRLAARRWLERAFRALAADERALVVLHELEGWPISDLARLYGRSDSAIKVRLLRARTKMKLELERFSGPDRISEKTNTATRNKQ